MQPAIRWTLGHGLGVYIVCVAGIAMAGAHTWDVNEIFSNADGTIQFVELVEANGTPGETGVPSQSLSSNSTSFTIGGAPPAPPTSNKFFLIGTAGYAALPGAPPPDAIIPAGSVPFAAAGGDTIAYGPYDSLIYGAGVLPTDGITALNRDLSTSTNSPTNYAGTTGSVDASPAAAVGSLDVVGALLSAALLAVAGIMLAMRARAETAT